MKNLDWNASNKSGKWIHKGLLDEVERFIIYGINDNYNIVLEDLKTGKVEDVKSVATGRERANEIVNRKHIWI